MSLRNVELPKEDVFLESSLVMCEYVAILLQLRWFLAAEKSKTKMSFSLYAPSVPGPHSIKNSSCRLDWSKPS